jgi:CHAT domain-containing protein/tetratricopeptide (TPR) repeat protein
LFAALLVLLTAAPLDPWAHFPQSFAECDVLVAAHPREFEAWFCYQQLSFKQPKAEWEAKAEAHLAARLRAHPREAYSELMLALVDPKDVLTEPLYRDAAAQFHEEKILDGEVVARTAWATGICEQGETIEAEKQLALALDAAKASGQDDLIAQAMTFAANCARAQADYGRALGLYREAHRLLSEAPHGWRTDWLLGTIDDGLGQTYAKTGRHQEALEIFQSQLAHQKAQSFLHACASHRVAEEAVRLARQGGMAWDEADGYVKTALDEEVSQGCRVYINGGEIYTRLLLAERLGPTAQGLEEVNRALALTRAEADPIRLCRVLRLLATLTIERDAKSLPAALVAAQEAIEVAKKFSSRTELAESLMTRAQVKTIGGDSPGGLNDSLEALAQFDKLRALQPEEMVRARTATEWSSAYHAAAGRLIESGRLEEALQTMESLRARSLLEALAPQAGAGSLQREREEVFSALSRVQRKLLEPALVADERTQGARELAQLEAREEALGEQLARARHGPAGAAPSPPTIAELRARLEPDEALLLFQIFDRDGVESAYLRGSSWVIAISKEKAQAFRVPDADRLAGEVDLLAGLVARRDGSEVSGAQVLHRQLLVEALGALGPSITRLSIVPDGALHRLPFEALRDGAAQPLGDKLEIALAPSAALWLRWRNEPAKRAQLPALALGDPLLGEPRDPALAQPAAGGDSAGLPDRRWDLWKRPGPLPGARAEALAVVAALGHGSEARLGEGASESFVKSADLGRYGLVHIAAHAIVDEARPERSAILLAPGAPGEDGLLQLREIGGLALSGSVVVLATCDSSSGELLQGEGVMSLARGFFQAGARAVVGSLWPLRDDEAQLFFSALYRRLGEGATLSNAVAVARRDRIKAGAPAAAWAGLVILGDGNAVPVRPPAPTPGPTRLRSFFISIAALVSLCAAIALISVWRRKPRAG